MSTYESKKLALNCCDTLSEPNVRLMNYCMNCSSSVQSYVAFLSMFIKKLMAGGFEQSDMDLLQLDYVDSLIDNFMDQIDMPKLKKRFGYAREPVWQERS